MKLPEIVGIAGTNGAGKDALGLLLADKCGYHFVSVTDLLREELRRNGVPIERENLSALSRQWRQESGDGVMFTKAIEQYEAEKAVKGYKGLAVGSIRHPGEAVYVKEHGGIVVWIDADQRLRYDRLQAAKRDRKEDQKTFEQFQADEYREMYPPPDAAPGTLNMKAVQDAADMTIINDHPTIEPYYASLIKQFEL